MGERLPDVAPDVTITGRADPPTEATTATFSFESTDPDAAFLCTLDGVLEPSRARRR